MYEQAIVVSVAGGIRGLSPAQPHLHTLPALSGAHLATPLALQCLPDEHAIFWADADVSAPHPAVSRDVTCV